MGRGATEGILYFKTVGCNFWLVVYENDSKFGKGLVDT